jgi:DNA-directed RNA polymerase specialized sigma24 family protein
MEIVAELTKDSLEKLLLRLDEDRELAAKKYETSRLGLVRFFEWRGCAFPEEHADEVIDRVASKLDQGEEIGNIGQYAIGVARFLFLEIVRERQKRETVLRQLPQTVVEDPSASEARLECIRHCLQSLSRENYEMVIAYYRDDGGNKIVLRKGMAQQLGISPRALRMRLQRIRARLERCASDCLSRMR